MTQIIIVVLAGFLLVTGCISPSPGSVPPPGNSNSSTTQSTTFTIATHISTPAAPVLCPQEGNNSFTIVRGDSFSYLGSVPPGKITTMRLWKFGKNYIELSQIPVNNKTFFFGRSSEQTSRMTTGTQKILFEFPTSDDSYGLIVKYVGKDNDTVLYDRTGKRVLNFRDIADNKVNGLDASNIVEQAMNMDKENVTGIILILKNPEIGINSIPDNYLGKTVTFEGTTNLAPGEKITLYVYEDIFGHCSKRQIPCKDSVEHCCGGLLGNVVIEPGTCGLNTWSWEVNTSQHEFRSGSFVIRVSEKNGLAENSRVFNILDLPKPNPFRYVTITMPEKNPDEDTIYFSGTVNTDYGPREKLFLQVSSDSGVTVNTTLPVVSDGAGYRWNYTLMGSALSPLGLYTVNITSVYDPKIRNLSRFAV